MSTAKTVRNRVAELRQRRAAAGLARVEVWAHPDDHPAIRAYAARLARKREKEKTPPA